MRNRLVCLVCGLAILSILISPPDLGAQDDPYVAFGDGQIADLRKDMHEHMSDSEISLDRSIHYYTVHSSELNAGAKISGGRREIVVDSTLLEAIDDLATMSTIAFLWNSEECFANYGNYLGDLANSNTALLLQGRQGNPTIPPFLYLRSHKDICPQLSPDVITTDERHAGALRTIAIKESIKWVLLHEFAHQLHNDVLHPEAKLSKAEQIAARRKQESAADDYAFQSMINPPELPTAAIPVIMLFCSLENFTLENHGDHPEAVRRLKSMMDQARSSPQWAKTMNMGTSAQRQQIQAMLAELDETVKAQK